MQPREFIIWVCSQPSFKDHQPPSEEEWREFRHHLSTTIGSMVAEKLTALPASTGRKLDSR